MTTAIVTDSTTSLPEGVRERPDVRVVPLTFSFGPEETYTDKVDLSGAEFYEKLKKSSVFPITSQPSVGAFVETYESLGAYDDILVLTLSRKFSGTYDSAVTAAGMIERPVEVLDTKSAEMGSGLILLEALRVVDEGGDFEQVKQATEAAIRRCKVLVAVSTLEYLERSGRIGRARRLLGTALDIRPVLRVEDGEVVPHKRTRGRKRQIAALLEELRPVAKAGRPLAYGHADAPELLAELIRSLNTKGRFVTQIGGVVGSHVGPGAYGVAYL
ncbi:MAG: DegV family protein [Actinomycetota bacterium]|nr:DegV family protein [Actinomycetota bacterium]HZY57489.1 DegV family protein [Rubrobacteraceae bacterium]